MCLNREKNIANYSNKKIEKIIFLRQIDRKKGRQMADKMEVAEGSLSPAVDQPEPEQQQPDHEGSRKKSKKHCGNFFPLEIRLCRS